MMVVFMLIYSWFLSNRKKKDEKSEWHEIWELFLKRMKKRGLILSEMTVQESDVLIKQSGNDQYLSVWNELVSGSFGNQDISKPELKKKIRKL